MLKKRFAFTLAEVLLTLIIIGVIAAITVPVLQTMVGEQERTAKVRKVYSMFAQAFTFARAAGADMEFEEVDKDQQKMNAWYDEFMRPRINTMKVCYDAPGCWNEKDTFYYNGQKIPENRAGIGIGNQIITAVLNDGTTVNMDMWSTQDKIKNQFGIDPKGAAVMVVYFDINGPKKPNIAGRDVFVMAYSAKIGLVPAYKDKSKTDVDKDCAKNKSGVSCIQRYLRGI